DGKWWAGTYGWGFTVDVIPYTGARADRGAQFQYRAAYGFANALLLTGDQRYVQLWKRVCEKVNENAKVVDGKTLYPHMYGTEEGDEGWYSFKPEKFAPRAEELFYWTQDRSVLEFLSSKPDWISYLDGDNPDYPEKTLTDDLATIRDRMTSVRNDTATPDTRMSDDMNALNPAITDSLIRLMLGGLPTGREGYPLHCRLRYFDNELRRAGIPADVAALVESMDENSTTVTLVNTDQNRHRTLTVQGGAYAEHQITSVTAENTTTQVDGSAFTVELAPGSGVQLNIQMQRYANQPTMKMPWAR
ncbi:MAG: hypothetical protein EA415_03795, partial [Sphaerobacteraceae bacterium]